MGRDRSRPCGQVLASGRFQRRATSPAIGLSGQMHGSVFLDAAGEVIRPALLWNDQRTAAECREIEAKAGGREALIRLVANPALTGFTAPKLLWVRKHEPQNWERVRQVLLAQGLRPLPPDRHVRDRGERRLGHACCSTSPIGAGAASCWASSSIDPALLPPCYESPEVSAQVSELGIEGDRACRWARRWSAAAATSRPARWATGSSARGWSRRRWEPRGSSSPTPISSGFDPLGRLQRGCHAVPGAWHVMGVVLAAGGSFQWFRNELGKAEVALAKAAGRRPLLPADRRGRAGRPGGRGALLPALLDRRANAPFRSRRQGGLDRPDRPPRPRPHDPQPARRGDLRHARQPGADPRDGRRHRAGPASRAAAPATRSGGRSRPTSTAATSTRSIRPRARPSASPCWPRSAPAASPSVPEACDATIRTVESTAVDPKAKAFYDRAYAIYRQLYRDLRESFQSISELVSALRQ